MTPLASNAATPAKPTAARGFRRRPRPRLAAFLFTALVLGPWIATTAGCTSNTRPRIVIEPTYAIERVADPDVHIRATWPTISPQQTLVEVSPAPGPNAAEFAYLPF